MPSTDELCEFFGNALQGQVLRREENQSDSGYGGGSSYWERRRALFLYEDGTFHLDDESFTTISAGGLSSPMEQREATDGTWTVQSIEEKPALALWKEDETSLTWWHLENDGDDVLHMDGEPWSRARIE
jgi:hypothetical protein